VQGWMANAAGVVNTNGPTGNIVVPVGTSMAASATTTMDFTKNLNAEAAVGATYQNSVKIYDSLGTDHLINVVFTKAAAPPANTWNWTASTTDPLITGFLGGAGTVSFDVNGAYTAGAGTLNLTVTGAAAMIVPVNFSGMTQYAGESTVTGTGNGYTSGSLENVVIDTSGVLTGKYSNGRSQALAQVSLATFNNPGGLIKAAENMYEESNNSGNAQVGTAASGGRGKIAPGTLEMSNVDLSAEFTNMIVTQRGFQANSKIITTSDEMLQDLVNLKR
jgi:flagellar hook protein FlgE